MRFEIVCVCVCVCVRVRVYVRVCKAKKEEIHVHVHVSGGRDRDTQQVNELLTEIVCGKVCVYSPKNTAYACNRLSMMYG